MIKGKVHRFGPHIDTDVIIPARYLTSTDPAELATHCMEPIDPEFPNKVSQGDIIVADQNFGSGSSREHAPIAIKGCGISCVVATTFARIFYRNAINVGLPILECPEIVGQTEAGDELEVDIASGLVINHTKGVRSQGMALPDFIREQLEAGGLVPYLAAKLAGERIVKTPVPDAGPKEADFAHD